MIVDSHCHLADDAFRHDLGEVVARATAARLGRVLCILSADEDEADEIDRALVVHSAWPAVEFSAGVHPHRAGPYAGRAPDAAEAARVAIGRTKAVALGEIGLDYHYDFAPRDVQREVFEAQIALALELDLPVVIHTREATDDTLAVLRQAGRGRLRGVMHCFSGTKDEARAALDIGFLISLSGIVTFPKAGSLREVARWLPANRLLTETDAPFLAPVPYRGKRNEPAWVAQTLAVIAGERGVAPADLEEEIAVNYAALVGPSENVPL